jgi:hypothetical protein
VAILFGSALYNLIMQSRLRTLVRLGAQPVLTCRVADSFGH